MGSVAPNDIEEVNHAHFWSHVTQNIPEQWQTQRLFSLSGCHT